MIISQSSSRQSKQNFELTHSSTIIEFILGLVLCFIVHVFREQARNDGYLEALKTLSLSFEENCDQIVRNKFSRNQPEYIFPDFLSFDYADILIGEKMEKKERKKFEPVIVFPDGRWRTMVDVNEKIDQHIKYREDFLKNVEKNSKAHEGEKKDEGIRMAVNEKSLIRAQLIETIKFEMGLRKWLQDRLAFAAAAKVSKLEIWKQILYLTGKKGFGEWSYFLNGCSWDFSRAVDRPTDMLERLSAIRDITKFVTLQQLTAKALFTHALNRHEVKKLDEAKKAKDEAEKSAQRDGDNVNVNGERMKERKI